MRGAQKYNTNPPGVILPPHVYDLANNAYKSMIRDGKSQSVVIRYAKGELQHGPRSSHTKWVAFKSTAACSGESGAGKTEETKLTLQFLAEVAKNEKFATENKRGVQPQCACGMMLAVTAAALCRPGATASASESNSGVHGECKNSPK
jgi:hypothetical protein